MASLVADSVDRRPRLLGQRYEAPQTRSFVAAVARRRRIAISNVMALEKQALASVATTKLALFSQGPTNSWATVVVVIVHRVVIGRLGPRPR